MFKRRIMVCKRTGLRWISKNSHSILWRIVGEDCPMLATKIRSPKGRTEPKIARTPPKNFLNNSRGWPGRYPVKQGFWGNRTKKFTRTLGKTLVTQFLCGTFSVPNEKLKGNVFNFWVCFPQTFPYTCTCVVVAKCVSLLVWVAWTKPAAPMAHCSHTTLPRLCQNSFCPNLYLHLNFSHSCASSNMWVFPALRAMFGGKEFGSEEGVFSEKSSDSRDSRESREPQSPENKA